MNPADILANLTPLDAELTEYEYTDEETGRIFEMRRGTHLDGAPRFFLSEFCPNGRMGEWDERGYLIRSWDEPRIKLIEAQRGPNGLLPTLKTLGVDVASVILFSGGYSINSIYHDSLLACADAIAQALMRNKRYKYTRPLTPEEIASRRHRDAVHSVEYWHEEAEAANEGEREIDGLFKDCRSMTGPLAPEIQRQILAYLNSPTQTGWLQVRNAQITAASTLWLAWTKVDSSAPLAGNDRCPDPCVLRTAIRYAVERQQGFKLKQKIKQKLQEVGPRGLRSV